MECRISSMNELSRSYRLQCAKVRLKLNKVKNLLQNGDLTAEERYKAMQDQTMLTAMYRELSDTSKYLEHYYDADARLYGNLSMSGMSMVRNND